MGAPSNSRESFQPAVAGFFCGKCGADCLSETGRSGQGLPDGLETARIICAEQVDPLLIRQAFESGADGILICGCLVGKCRALDDNAEVLTHIHRAKRVLKEMGIAPGRLRQEWVCSPQVENIRDILDDFTARLRKLGPLKIPVPGASGKNPGIPDDAHKADSSYG